MTLKELAPEYRRSAAALSERIAQLNSRRRAASGEEKLRIGRRIAVLQTMYGEAVEAAAVMERYYDRRAGRNGSFTI